MGLGEKLLSQAQTSIWGFKTILLATNFYSGFLLAGLPLPSHFLQIIIQLKSPTQSTSAKFSILTSSPATLKLLLGEKKKKKQKGSAQSAITVSRQCGAQGKGRVFYSMYCIGTLDVSVRYRTICICVYIYYFHVICKTEISNELSM